MEVFAELLLIVAWVMLPYSLVLLPVGVFILWYLWRPRKLRFSLATMFWVVTFTIMYFALVFVLIKRT